MKRVGLIDNLQDLPDFLANRYETASAADCMAATGGNTGNVAFVHAARKVLGHPLRRVVWGERPATVRAEVDHLVICCANQLGPHADLGEWADHLEALGLPVTLLGLGAQSDALDRFPALPAGTLRFLDVVRHHRGDADSNLAVRGDYTRDLLATLGHAARPIGCPSLQIAPGRDLGAAILRGQAQRGEIERVAVAAGNPWHGPSAWLEALLVDVVEQYAGDYVVQHPQEMLAFAFGEVEALSPEAVARFLAVYGPRFDLDGLLAWYRRHAVVHVDAASWLRALRRCDLALGPRYHGVALAVQAGRPGCVLTIDGRTEELCRGTGLKQLSAQALKGQGLTAPDLVALARWTPEDAERFDAIRHRKARDLADFLRANGLRPADHLLRNAGEL